MNDHEALRRKSVRMETEPTEPDAPPGTSRFGGMPDLPPDLEWPRSEAGPLDFIAQIDLCDLHESSEGSTEALPKAGVLYFFYGVAGGEGGKVLYFDGPLERLRPATPPTDFEPHRIFAPRTMFFWTEDPEPPPLESPQYPARLGSVSYNEAWADAARVFEHLLDERTDVQLADGERPRHRVCGWPDPLQSSAGVNLEGVASGLPPSEWGTTKEFWERAADWQLILQADSDPDADFLLGDLGVLYFMIRTRDLEARRFDEARVDWQSH